MASCLAEKQKARDKENTLPQRAAGRLWTSQPCSIKITMSDTAQETEPPDWGSQLERASKRWELSRVRIEMAEKLQTSLLFTTFSYLAWAWSVWLIGIISQPTNTMIRWLRSHLPSQHNLPSNQVRNWKLLLLSLLIIIYRALTLCQRMHFLQFSIQLQK